MHQSEKKKNVNGNLDETNKYVYSMDIIPLLFLHDRTLIKLITNYNLNYFYHQYISSIVIFKTSMLVFLCRFRAPSAILHTLKMATTSFSCLQFAMSRSCIPSSQNIAEASAVVLGGKSMIGSWNKLASA